MAKRFLFSDFIIIRSSITSEKEATPCMFVNVFLSSSENINDFPSTGKIFKSGSYKHPWRLDFTKGKFSVEVAFNHGEATAWNLMKCRQG